MTNFRSARRGTAGFNSEAARPQNMGNPFDTIVRGYDHTAPYIDAAQDILTPAPVRQLNDAIGEIARPVIEPIANEYMRRSEEAQRYWAEEYVRNENAGVPGYDPGQIARQTAGLLASLGGCNTGRTAAFLGMATGVSRALPRRGAAPASQALVPRSPRPKSQSNPNELDWMRDYRDFAAEKGAPNPHTYSERVAWRQYDRNREQIEGGVPNAETPTPPPAQLPPPPPAQLPPPRPPLSDTRVPREAFENTIMPPREYWRRQSRFRREDRN